MSKVVQQSGQGDASTGGTGTPNQGQGAGQGTDNRQDWVLDDKIDDRPRQRWIMDESPLEQQERQQLREQFRQQGGGAGPGAGQGGAPGAGEGVRPQFVPGAAPGQGFQYTTKSGYTFRGDTPDAVLAQMENALVGMAGRIQNIESARTYMGGQGGYDRGTSAQPQRQSQQPDTWTPATYDPVKFYQALASDKPLEAMREIINPLLQEYFGVEDPKHALDRSYTVTQKINDSLETADFLSNNPHFPVSDANADLLLRRIDAAGVPLTRWNLEVAFNQLMQERLIVPAQQQFQQQPGPGGAGNGNGNNQGNQGGFDGQGWQQPGTGSRGANAPPGPGGFGGEGAGADRELSEMEFETLSTKDQRAYLVKRGLI